LLILGQKYISQNNNFNFIVVWFISETVGEFPKSLRIHFMVAHYTCLCFCFAFSPT